MIFDNQTLYSRKLKILLTYRNKTNYYLESSRCNIWDLIFIFSNLLYLKCLVSEKKNHKNLDDTSENFPRIRK